MLAAFVLTTSALFVNWALAESLVHGRLAAVPHYDDVVYFVSGTKILQSLSDGCTILSLVRTIHSPYSELLAATSYAILGQHDWAPYAANVVVVICYLAGLSYFLRHLPLGVQLALLLLFISLPFATMAVVEFRPDLMWAILVGFTAMYLVTTSEDFSSRIEAAGLGVLYGAAMMTKPSTFLMTTAVIGLGGLLRVLRAALSGKLIASRFFIWMGYFLLCSLLVAGPYYFLNFDRTWRYFYENSFGINKDIWILRQTISQHLGYYIDSQNASLSNLGRWRLIILLFVAFSLTFGILREREPRKRAVLYSLATILIAVWLASSLFGMKSPFLGGAFYGTLIYASVYLLAELLKPLHESLSRPAIQALMFAGLATTSFMMNTWPAYSEWNATRAEYYRNVSEGVLKAIRTALKNYGPVDEILDVYYTNSSPVPSALLKLRALQKRFPLRVHSGSLVRSMESQRALFEASDVIIVQDSGLPEVNGGFPGELLQTQVTQEVLSRPEFTLRKEIEVGDRKRVYVLFNKNSLLPKR